MLLVLKNKCNLNSNRIQGPISLDGSAVEITNWPDKADRTLRTELLPPSLFPKGHTYLLNDLESCCYGLLALHAADQLGNYFSPLWYLSLVSQC